MGNAEQVPRRRRRAQRAAGASAAGPVTGSPPEAGAEHAAGAGQSATGRSSTKQSAGQSAKQAPAGQSAKQSSAGQATGGTVRSDGPRRKAGRAGEPGQAHGERGWRDLAGSTPSLVGVSGAMRARDVARPSPDELAAAERDLVIVRRQWQPPVSEPDVP